MKETRRRLGNYFFRGEGSVKINDVVVYQLPFRKEAIISITIREKEGK